MDANFLLALLLRALALLCCRLARDFLLRSLASWLPLRCLLSSLLLFLDWHETVGKGNKGVD